MAWVRGLYTRARCTCCKRWIEVQISATHATQDVDAIARNNDWHCAECVTEKLYEEIGVKDAESAESTSTV